MVGPGAACDASTVLSWWRHAVLVALLAGTLLAILSLDPIAQDQAYHRFADDRGLAGIPNFLDVMSNLVFALVGVAGLRVCLRTDVGVARAAWCTLFAGVALVSIGSAWYHWAPDDASLVWDRLAMTVGFMGLFVALLAEYVSPRLTSLLVPAALAGPASVLYWHATGDLRLYAWIQLAPLLCIPVLLALYRGRWTHAWLLPVALAGYVLAKLFEAGDAAVFQATGGMVGGHTVKHLLAAAGCYCIVVMLRRRRPRS